MGDHPGLPSAEEAGDRMSTNRDVTPLLLRFRHEIGTSRTHVDSIEQAGAKQL